MASKRSNQSVPSVETGHTTGDFHRSQSIKWQNKGGRNATTNEGMRGSGLAPKPYGGAALPGNDRPSMPSNGGLARVKESGKAPSAGSFLPVRKPKAGVVNQQVGQREVVARGPGTSIAEKTQTPKVGNPVATSKPARRGKGAAFYGEY